MPFSLALTRGLSVAGLLFGIGVGNAAALVGGRQAASQEKSAAPAAVTPAAIARGDTIFHKGGLCYACHGNNAEGAVGPNLTDAEWLHGDGSYDMIVATVTSGVPAEKAKKGVPMPPKGGSSITDEEVKAVAAYVYSLSHKSSIKFATRLLARTEIPVSTSKSKGQAELEVLSNGTIESDIEIDNKGEEVVRFCHIHVINTDAGIGPIVWFLTPTGVQLQIADREIRFRQDADYVSNAVFGADAPANEAIAHAALLAEPSRFYVNCHSNAFPPGFIRSNLPGDDDEDNDAERDQGAKGANRGGEAQGSMRLLPHRRRQEG